MRIGDQDPLPIAVDDMRRYTDDGRVRRHVAQDDRSRSYTGICADGYVTEYIRVIADKHAVAKRWMAFSAGVVATRAAQRYTLVERDVIPDDRGFADYHAHAVVDQQAASNLRAGVDLETGPEARDLRENARGQTPTAQPEPMVD